MTEREYMRERRRKAREREVKMICQKWMGVFFLIMTVLIIWMASQGTTVYDRDATGIFITLPLGLYLLFSKECWLY